MPPAPHRSSALPLALAYAALLVYASLYPFEGWRWPPGAAWQDLLQLRWFARRGIFDEVSNALGYLPLGLLLTVLALRRGAGGALWREAADAHVPQKVARTTSSGFGGFFRSSIPGRSSNGFASSSTSR